MSVRAHTRCCMIHPELDFPISTRICPACERDALRAENKVLARVADLGAKLAEAGRPRILKDLFFERDRYREALERIAVPLGSGCGCGGVMCECFNPVAVRIELDARIDLAQSALNQ